MQGGKEMKKVLLALLAAILLCCISWTITAVLAKLISFALDGSSVLK
jgi:hypothetical protein